MSSSSSSPSYWIHFVDLYNSFKRSFVDSLLPTSTVEEAINAFLAKNNLDVSQSASVKLHFSGKEIQRERTLASYGVQRDSIIHVLLPHDERKPQQKEEKQEADQPKEAACDAPKVLEEEEEA